MTVDSNDGATGSLGSQYGGSPPANPGSPGNISKFDL